MLVTDDIELQATGHVSVCIMARKYTGRHLFRSRGSIKGYSAKRTSHAAGFIIGAATTTILEEDLDGIEIEFESRRGWSAPTTPRLLPWLLGPFPFHLVASSCFHVAASQHLQIAPACTQKVQNSRSQY